MADSSVQELIIKYRADVTELQAKITQIENELRKVGKASDDSGKKVTETFRASASAGNIAADAMKKVGTAIVAAFAVDRIISFGKESVKAFQEAELNAKKLEAAVSASGGLQEDFQNLINQSVELQKVTIFSDDDIQRAQTLALQFGLTSDQVESLIPLVTDFASATGQDLNSALSAVLRGVEGNAKALKIYGIQVDSSKSKAENFADIQDQITKKFAGQAQVVANTSAGALAKLGNAYDDLKEKIGGLLAPAVEGFADLADSILKITEIPLSETLEKEAISFDVARTQLSGLNVGSKERVQIIKNLQAQYPEYLGNIDAETVSNEELNKALDKVNNSLIVKIALQKSDEAIQEQQEETGEALRKTAEARAALASQLAVIRKRANAEEVKANLDGLPLEVQANELIQGRIKLTGISQASLVKLTETLRDYNAANLELSKQSVNVNDLVASRIQQEKDLLEIYGLEKNAKKDTLNAGEQEEAAALARLKNISNLTTAELLKIRATLKGFNDLDAQDAIASIEKELDARKKLGEKEVTERQKALDELHALEQKISDDNIKVRAAEQSKILALEKEKQVQLRDLVQKFSDANQGVFTDIIKEFNDTGIIDLDEVNKQLATIKAPVEELALFDEAIKKLNNTFDVLTQKEKDAFNIENLKKDLQETIDSIDLGVENQSFTITQKFAQESPSLNTDQRAEAEAKLQADLLAIKIDADQKIIDETKKTNDEIIKIDSTKIISTADIEKQITKDKQTELELRLKAEKEAAEKQLQIQKEIAQKRKEIEKEILDTAIDGTQQVITESIQVANDAQIESIEAVRDAQLAAIDSEIEGNNKARENGVTNRQEFEKRNEELLKQRIDAENTAAAKIKAVKRKQFEADQLAAISEVIINNIVNASEFPALAGFYAGLAILQSGIILARPNPYKKGSKKTLKGDAIVGEEGPELVVMPAEAKVLTASKTKSNAEIVDAIIDNKLDEHIRKVYVEPALVEQSKKLTVERSELLTRQVTHAVKNIYKEIQSDEHINLSRAISIADEAIKITPEFNIPEVSIPVKKVKENFLSDTVIRESQLHQILNSLNVTHYLKEAAAKHEIKKQELLATTIANSFKINNEGASAKQLKKIHQQGAPITNSKEVARNMAKEIAKILPDQYSTARRYS